MNFDWSQLFKDIQPITSFVGAVVSLTALSFIARLYSIVKEAQEERIKAVAAQKGVVEERLKNAESELERTEKWYDRKVRELKGKLSDILENEGITTQNLFNNPNFINNLRSDISSTVKKVLDEMSEIQEVFEKQELSISDPDWHLQMAKASTFNDEWLIAARHYKEYLKHYESNWKVHFLCGVAYANSREGKYTNLEGLRSYSDAITFCPDDIDNNMKSRMHTYRGALLKRLHRLDEAENEFLLVQNWATAEYEVADNNYNLACIYAMKSDKTKMIHHLQQLSFTSQFMNGLRNNPYFANYRNDPDFLTVIHK